MEIIMSAFKQMLSRRTVILLWKGHFYCHLNVNCWWTKKMWMPINVTLMYMIVKLNGELPTACVEVI